MRSVRRWAGIAAALLAPAGVAALLLGAAGPAGASSNSTTTAVTIASASTLTDNTAAITFNAPVSLPGQSTNQPGVSLNVVSNDAAGYAVSAVASNLTAGASSIPFTALQACGKAMQDSCAGMAFSGGRAFTGSGASSDPLVTDTTSAASADGGDNLTDVYGLNVPNATAGSYSGLITYSLAGK
jgi:hypothetical protein